MKLNKRFIFHEDKHKEACKAYIDTIEIDEKHPIEAIFRPYKRNISEAQRALMWIWHKQWSQHFGDSPQEQHIRFKADYVLPILLREQTIAGLSGAYDAVRVNRDLGDPRPLKAFYDLLSTNMLKTHEMAEALTQYEQDTALKGLAFLTKGPEYEDAMR